MELMTAMKNRGETMFLPREFVRYPLNLIEFRLFTLIYLEAALEPDNGFSVSQEKLARKFAVRKRSIGDALEILQALRMIERGELVNEFYKTYEFRPLPMDKWVEPAEVHLVRERVEKLLAARRADKRRGRSRPKIVALQSTSH